MCESGTKNTQELWELWELWETLSGWNLHLLFSVVILLLVTFYLPLRARIFCRLLRSANGVQMAIAGVDRSRARVLWRSHRGVPHDGDHLPHQPDMLLSRPCFRNRDDRHGNADGISFTRSPMYSRTLTKWCRYVRAPPAFDCSRVSRCFIWKTIIPHELSFFCFYLSSSSLLLLLLFWDRWSPSSGVCKRSCPRWAGCPTSSWPCVCAWSYSWSRPCWSPFGICTCTAMAWVTRKTTRHTVACFLADWSGGWTGPTSTSQKSQSYSGMFVVWVAVYLRRERFSFLCPTPTCVCVVQDGPGVSGK